MSAKIERLGVQDEHAFTIKLSKHAIHTLSSGLYPDKPRAIIRELSCNAYDSHVEAGKKDIPFDVHLPTSFDPLLRIRDYGVSLDHRDVMELYTTYFHSTKAMNSSEVVGKLGLGSKTPFAYTNTFTVTAFKYGRKRVYSAFYKEDGIPTIALLNDVPSDEAQGLLIEVPVSPADFGAFQGAAREVLVWFDPLPQVSNSIVRIVPPEFDEEWFGNGWRRFRTGHSARGNLLAKQGTVVYPIDMYSVKSPLKENIRSAISDLQGFLIEFPLGTLEVTASREALSYTQRTQANIARRLTEVYKELVEKSHTIVDSKPTLWEKLAAWKQTYSNFPFLRGTLRANAKKISPYFDGAALSIPFSDLKVPEIKTYDYSSYRIRDSVANLRKNNVWKAPPGELDYSGNAGSTSNKNFVVCPPNGMYYINHEEDNIPNHVYRMAVHHAEKNYDVSPMILTFPASVTKAQIQDFLHVIGEPPVIWIKDIVFSSGSTAPPVPPSAIRTKTAKLFVWRGASFGQLSSVKTYDLPEKETFFVLSERDGPVHSPPQGFTGAYELTSTTSFLPSFVHAARNFLTATQDPKLDLKICAIPKTHWSVFLNFIKKNPGRWIDLFDYVYKLMVDFKLDQTAEGKIRRSVFLWRKFHASSGDLREFRDFYPKLGLTCAVNKFNLAILDPHLPSEQEQIVFTQGYALFQKAFGSVIEKEASEFDSIKNEFLERYPLLSRCVNYAYSDLIPELTKEFQEYIDLIDSKKGNLS